MSRVCRESVEVEAITKKGQPTSTIILIRPTTAPTAHDTRHMDARTHGHRQSADALTCRSGSGRLAQSHWRTRTTRTLSRTNRPPPFASPGSLGREKERIIQQQSTAAVNNNSRSVREGGSGMSIDAANYCCTTINTMLLDYPPKAPMACTWCEEGVW